MLKQKVIGSLIDKTILLLGEKMVIGQSYKYRYGSHTCKIYNRHSGKYLGLVTLFNGIWTPKYADGVRYLPINSALFLLGYEAAKDSNIE